jgi:hypothetical protein
MDYSTFDENEIKFPIPSGIIVSGPSSSGKTQLVLRLLENADKMFDPPPKAILWAYGEYTDKIAELQRKGYHIHQGVPSDEIVSKMPKPFIFVMDDLIQDIDSKRLANIFTRNSHHQNFTPIFITQSLFDKAMRVPRSNSHFIFLLRCPNDQQSIRSLATQLFPREANYFYSAFKQACEEKYGYLLISLHPSFSHQLRLR